MSQAIDTMRALLRVRKRFRLVGPPGCGKTAMVRAAADAEGLPMFYGVGGRTADLMDRLDAAGAVWPDAERGRARLLPLDDLAVIFEHRGPGVWFVDELGRAAVEVQGALCSAFDRIKRENPELVVVTATNRPSDRAGVTALSEQLRSRTGLGFSMPSPGDAEGTADGPVLLCSWGEFVAGWCEWALSAKLPPVVVGWHRATSGRTLYLWKQHADPAISCPDLRSWCEVGELWAAGLRDFATVAATIGKPTAAEFTTFARMAAQCPTPDLVRMDPTGAVIPDDAGARYFVATALGAAMGVDDAEPFLVYADRLPRVFGALLARDAFSRIGAELSGTAAWAKWFRANQELFTGRGAPRAAA